MYLMCNQCKSQRHGCTFTPAIRYFYQTGGVSFVSFFPNGKYLVSGYNSFESDLLSVMEDLGRVVRHAAPSWLWNVTESRQAQTSHWNVNRVTDRASCQCSGALNIVSISQLHLKVGVVVYRLSEFHIPETK